MAEADETFTVTLSEPASAVSTEQVRLLVASATGTIIDNDASVLSITSVPLVEGNDAAIGKMQFTVNANPPSTLEFTVDWATSVVAGVDSATEDTDYTGANGQLTFAVGDSTKTIEIDVLGDNIPEPDETFTVTLSNVTLGGQIPVDADSAQGRILNDDGSILSIADVSLEEVNEDNTGRMMFTVTAFPSAPADTELTATWTTSVEEGDTATADTDYTEATGTVTIAAGQSSGTFEIVIIGDNTPEFDETFTVTLSNASTGAAISSDAGTAKGTITNNDGTGLSIESVSLQEGATGDTTNMVFTVTTVPPSSSAITYSWATSTESDDTATFDLDYTASSGTNVAIAPNAEQSAFSVPILGDYLVEGDETFTVTLSNPSGATLLVAQAKGMIIDDEPEVSIAADSGFVNENEGPAMFMLSATGLSETRTLSINATPDQGELNFLTEGASGVADDFDVEFRDDDADGTYTGMLSLAIVDDIR